MIVLLKLIVTGAMMYGTAVLSQHIEGNPLIAPSLVFFGGVSFFLGPYITGSGFFMRGAYVDAVTPTFAWRIFGILLWLAAGITMLYMWTHPPT